MVHISTLRLPGADQAGCMLNQSLSLCSHIISENSWQIVRVCEFLPRSESLLGRNTNRGELIEVRLRKSKSPNEYDSQLHSALET